MISGPALIGFMGKGEAETMTALLSIAGCVLLFLGIWGVTVTLPTKLLAGYFPKDVQEKLKPRLDHLPMSPKRVLGWVILVLFIAGYIGLFVYAGIDGLRQGFTFPQFFFRFLTIGAVIKVFDIVCLDYFLLTRRPKGVKDGRSLDTTVNSRSANVSRSSSAVPSLPGSSRCYRNHDRHCRCD